MPTWSHWLIVASFVPCVRKYALFIKKTSVRRQNVHEMIGKRTASVHTQGDRIQRGTSVRKHPLSRIGRLEHNHVQLTAGKVPTDPLRRQPLAHATHNLGVMLSSYNVLAEIEHFALLEIVQVDSDLTDQRIHVASLVCHLQPQYALVAFLIVPCAILVPNRIELLNKVRRRIQR